MDRWDHVDKVRRLGIMGGTFDPIHYGHLITAETVREKAGLDQIMFIPSGLPPHKVERKIAGNEDRYNMVALAIDDNPYFSLSTIELERQGYSYTIDTITELKRVLPPYCQLFFILGADALFDLTSWKSPERLLTLCHFIVMTRSGYPEEELNQLVKKYNQYRDGLGIQMVEVPNIDISSTDIRSRIEGDRSIKYLVPQQVDEYIKIHRLYK